MAEKKEIFDYLRNQQKSAEIESKVNGINLWVLIGSIAFIAWQLLGINEEKFWSNPELALRTLLFTEGLYIFISLGLSVNRTQNELRYAQWRIKEIESPFLILVSGIFLIAPPALAIAFLGKSLGAIILGLMGLTALGVSIAAAFMKIFTKETIVEKFPKPQFEPTLKYRTVSSLISGTLMLIPSAEQGIFLYNHQITFGSSLIKQMALLAALYYLLMLIVDSKHRSTSFSWTYSLETELLIGTITPEIALRRIEHRQLGRRLQDIMDNFFDDLDRKFENFNTLLEEFITKAEAIKQVPVEYSAERASRVKEAAHPIYSQINQLNADCKEFSGYLKKLKEKSIGSEKSVISLQLAGLTSRHEQYLERLSKATMATKEISSAILSGKTG